MFVSASSKPSLGRQARKIIHRLGVPSFVILACWLASLFGCEVAGAQFGAPDAGPHGSIEVHLRAGDGSVFSGAASIRLLATGGYAVQDGMVDGSGTARFVSLAPGTYVVEAKAPGFVTATETVVLEMKYSSMNVDLRMKPERSDNSATAPLAVPILAPNARKEVEKGLEAFRQKDMVQARKHFEKALALAPGNPDVQYLMGALEIQENNNPAAQEHLEKAIQIFPNHVRALELLGELYCRQGHAERAVPLLEQAVSLEDGSWKAHWKLASAYLQANDPAKAQQQCERAIALGKADAGVAQVLDAVALADLGKWDAAESVLDTFIRAQPNDPAAPRARDLLAEAKQRQTRAFEETPLPLINKSGLFAAAALLQPEPVSSRLSAWSEPGIDEFVPKVAPNVTCALPQILTGAGKQVERLMDSLEKFEATERVEHFTVDKQGALRSPEVRSFDYVVSVSHPRHGVINLDEYRNGSLDPTQFPASIATEGLPSTALIFLPEMISDFDFNCEGLGGASQGPAWQLHFRQKPNRSNRIRAYVVGGRYYPIKLKGRAWIDAATYQVVRLESETVDPIPEIHLQRERLSIEYAPVEFTSRNVRLYLPSHAELLVVRDKSAFYRTHAFSNFQLFSVGTGQKIGAPNESYTFTNLSDQNVSGQFTITPLFGHSLSPISVTFTISPHATVYKAVGPGKDLNIPSELIASARFVYAGVPGTIQGNASLTNASTLEIVPEPANPAAPYD
jgi:tetratricopeptide (TPR) repeat protein